MLIFICIFRLFTKKTACDKMKIQLEKGESYMLNFIKFFVLICIMLFGNDCRYENDVNHMQKRNKMQYTENVYEYQKTVTSDYLIVKNEEGMLEQVLICNTPSIEPKVIVPVCVGIRIYLTGIDSTNHSTNGVTVNINGDYLNANYTLTKNGQSVNGNFSSGTTFYITGTYSLKVKCICGEYFYKSFTINELSLVVDETDAVVEQNGVPTTQNIISVTNSFTYEMNSTVGTVNSRFVAHSLNPANDYKYYYCFDFNKRDFRFSQEDTNINLDYFIEYDLMCGEELISSSTLNYQTTIDYSNGIEDFLFIDDKGCYMALDLGLKHSEDVASGGYYIIYKSAIVDITFQLESVAVSGDLYGTVIPIDGNYGFSLNYGISMVCWGTSTSQLEEYFILHYGLYCEIANILIDISVGPYLGGIITVFRTITSSFF